MYLKAATQISHFLLSIRCQTEHPQASFHNVWMIQFDKSRQALLVNLLPRESSKRWRYIFPRTSFQLSSATWRRTGAWMYISIHSLTSALDGGEWSASRPGRFTPKERATHTHSIGDWVGPRADLDTVVKRKIPSSRHESNPRTPIVQPAA
jgi:hypothetical protein